MLKKLSIFTLILLPLMVQSGEKMKTFYDFNATNIHGEEQSMAEYKGKVLLIVNVASKCGFTPQYEGLEKLYTEHKEEELEILAFPCNQFGEQESGTHKEIQNFCKVNYGVTFPLFEKIEVNGEKTHPLYVYLKKEATGFLWTQSIKWNFTKFLVDKKGKVISRYGSSTKPKDIEGDIIRLLEELK